MFLNATYIFNVMYLQYKQAYVIFKKKKMQCTAKNVLKLNFA